MPDTSISEVHIHRALHGDYEGKPTQIPFCELIQKPEQLRRCRRWFPLYDSRAEEYVGTWFLCLTSEHPTNTPVGVLRHMMNYVSRWRWTAEASADRWGPIARGEVEGDRQFARWWVEHHLVDGVSDELKSALLARARRETARIGSGATLASDGVVQG